MTVVFCLFVLWPQIQLVGSRWGWELDAFARLITWQVSERSGNRSSGAGVQHQLSYCTLLMSSLGTRTSANVRNECNKPLSWYHYAERWRWGNWEDTAALICLWILQSTLQPWSCDTSTEHKIVIFLEVWFIIINSFNSSSMVMCFGCCARAVKGQKGEKC